MWRLKIAEGGEDPYIYSTNNFVGRQIWEFDPVAGSPQERAEVEQARLNFYNNRYQIKPSADLLWRMQVRTYTTTPFLPCHQNRSTLIYASLRPY
jgi:beta-amyrin synthase